MDTEKKSENDIKNSVITSEFVKLFGSFEVGPPAGLLTVSKKKRH